MSAGHVGKEGADPSRTAQADTERRRTYIIWLIGFQVCGSYHVRMPTGDDFDHMLDGFETRWGVPHCAGAVNGTHSYHRTDLSKKVLY